MKNFINLTDRNIDVYDKDGIKSISIPPSGQIARVDIDFDINHFDYVQYGKFIISGLPSPCSDANYYIVDREVKLALKAYQIDNQNFIVPLEDLNIRGRVYGSSFLIF